MEQFTTWSGIYVPLRRLGQNDSGNQRGRIPILQFFQFFIAMERPRVQTKDFINLQEEMRRGSFCSYFQPQVLPSFLFEVIITVHRFLAKR